MTSFRRQGQLNVDHLIVSMRAQAEAVYKDVAAQSYDLTPDDVTALRAIKDFVLRTLTRAN